MSRAQSPRPAGGPLGALFRAKRQIAVHTLKSVQRESKLKVAFVSVSALLLLIGIYGGARLAFRMLEIFGSELLGNAQLSLGDLVMARLLSTFALTLFVLLTFSNVLIAYATLFRSREMPYLVQSPIPVANLFLGRFYECVSFSSWATAFLGGPILLAYGMEAGAPLSFYPALVAFYVPFVVIPGAIGCMVTLFAMRHVDKLRGRWVPLGVLAVAVGLGMFRSFRSRFETPDLSDPESIQTILELLTTTQSPFLPSQWLAQGVLATATGNLGEAVFMFLLLASNAALLLWLAVLAAERFFPVGWSALMAADEQRPPGEAKGILTRLEGLMGFLPEPYRSLVIKDLRLFWREPSQWSQFLLFFGIMAVYLANLGQTQNVASLDPRTWQAWGTLLNLTASMLVLASLTTRFIYPLISLEGRRIWILGLSPVTMGQIVAQKFWLSVATTSVFTVGITVLSAVKLDLAPLPFALSVLAVVATTFALSGLAVGLGSLYPNFEEDNPSRVVSGLGGTLNFLLSLAYIVGVTAGLGVVLLWHNLEARLGTDSFPWVVAGVLIWTLGLTFVACRVPLRLGLKHLQSIEL